MSVFFVELHSRHRSGRNVWFFFETDSETVSALTERLNRGQLVAGTKLSFRPAQDEQGTYREVLGGTEETLSLSEVKAIRTPNGRFVRFEGEAGA